VVEWADLVAAVAILLVAEGILPFLSPSRSRRVFEQMSRLGDRELRVAGLLGMLAGLGLLFYVRH
jgi:uncharacterized protein YjeT (DUF2065 family)